MNDQHNQNPHSPIVVKWEPVTTPKSWADYECPLCGGIERVSTYMDLPIMHRHKYGAGELQSGLMILRRIEK